MNEVILIFWMLFWIIFLVMSIIEKRGVVFGFLAGLWIFFLGIYLILDGFDTQTGITITSSGNIQTGVYTYQEVVPPFSSYSILWAVPFILLGMYIMFLASTKKKKEDY